MNTDPCIKGDESGLCCCNCQHQKPIYRHPGNVWTGVGEIDEIFGYGCTVFNVIIFSEMANQHGSCELHKLNEDEK